MELYKIVLNYSLTLTFAAIGVGLNYSAPANAQKLLNSKLLLSQASSNKSVPCRFGAYVIDKDPNGLNVRKAPNSSIIGKLPTNALIVNVYIIACQGEWVQISRAESTQPDGIPFQGRGWVYAPLLGTSTSGQNTEVYLYKEPNTKSRKLGKVPANTEVQLLGGKGKWIFAQYGKLRGWLAPKDQCPTTLTTCT